MTIQALWMLHQLKRLQMTEDGFVFLDEDALMLTTVHEDGAPYHTKSLKRRRNSFRSLFTHLEKDGVIVLSKPSKNYIQVTHAGWHLWQTLMSEFCRFLFTSVFVPIVVSAITTLITLWLSGQLD